MTTKVENQIKEFLNEPSVIDALKDNDLEKVYSIHSDNFLDFENTDLTEYLYKAGIQPYQYLDEIPNYSYYGCGDWIKEKELIIARSFIIGEKAFCFHNFNSIKIGRQVQTIRPVAFSESWSIENLEFEDGCEAYIGFRAFYRAFYDPKKLYRINIPETIDAIDDQAFDSNIELLLPRGSKTWIHPSLKDQIRWI